MAFDVQDGTENALKTRRLSLDQKTAAASGARPDAKGKGRAINLDNDEMHSEAPQSPQSCYESDEDESMHCAICLSVIDDRTVLQPCNHDAFCFVCILAWTDQSRKCPLCISAIDLLLHNIRSEKDFQRHYLPPLVEKEDPQESDGRSLYEGARRQLRDRPTHPRFKYSDWQARNRPASMPDMDQEDLALQKRKYVYRHGLYVKHVASNRFTRYRDHTAQQFSSSPELKQRLTRWLRRELQVFDGVDLEFLVGYCVSIASQLELRSDAAVRLLSEFLGDRDAEHFLHEAHSFMRSPFKDIRNYDRAVQYDRPDRKISNYKPAYETQKASTAIASQRRADPMLLPPEPRNRRRRSDPISSDSEPDQGRRRSFSKSRRRSSYDRPQDSPVRSRRDLYIPDYARTRDRRPSDTYRRASGNRYDRDLAIPETPNLEEESRTELDARQVETPVIVDEMPSSNGIGNAIQELSDAEDIISLGGSDVEAASLVLPTVQASTAGLQHNGHAAEPTRKQDKPAISIRGKASLAHAPPSATDRIERDLLSRISLPTIGRMHQDRLLHDKSTVPRDTAPTQKYSGTVSNDLKATLMARLKEEKDLHNAAEVQSAVVETAEREESLRQNVLAIMAAKRQRTAQLDDHMAQLRARLEQGRTPVIEPVPALTDRQAALRAKIEKEKRLAELRSRLLEEKQSLRSSL